MNTATMTREAPITGDWRTRATCRDEDPELFFPVGTAGPALDQIGQAKLVCRRCPVITECLVHALERGEDGIWGGTTGDEREHLRRDLRR